jgi:hypothetical protein
VALKSAIDDRRSAIGKGNRQGQSARAIGKGDRQGRSAIGKGDRRSGFADGRSPIWVCRWAIADLQQ